MPLSSQAHALQHWHSGHQVRLLIDGKQFFPAMLGAIDAANSFILLEIYLVNSGTIIDRFVARLCAAAKRGVRVYIILDHYGARGLSAADRETLTSSGIELQYFNPLRLGQLTAYLVRNHRKLLCVDGNVALVGGMGLSDDFLPTPPNTQNAWRETVIEIKGPVVQDWVTLFSTTWRRSSGQKPMLPDPVLPTSPAGKLLGRLTYSPRSGQRNIARATLNRLRKARTRIWFATAYFIPTRKVRRALTAAARHGVDVRILVPGPAVDHPAVRYASRHYYTRLLRNGVRIYEYQPRFLHMKVYLADNWVSIGSANLDRWNMRWNLEANQEIDNVQFASDVAAMFQQDFRQSEEIVLNQWARRHRVARLQEWFWGEIGLLLARWPRRQKDKNKDISGLD